jgi:hypothetical protein
LIIRFGSKRLAGSRLPLRAGTRSRATNYGNYDNYSKSGLSNHESQFASISYPSQKCHKAEIARCTSFDQWMEDCF